jgi:hypothetical protein
MFPEFRRQFQTGDAKVETSWRASDAYLLRWDTMNLPRYSNIYICKITVSIAKQLVQTQHKEH